MDDELAPSSQSLATCLDAPAMQCNETFHEREPDAEAAFRAIDRGVHLR
jgi:hypothetical protein